MGLVGITASRSQCFHGPGSCTFYSFGEEVIAGSLLHGAVESSTLAGVLQGYFYLHVNIDFTAYKKIDDNRCIIYAHALDIFLRDYPNVTVISTSILQTHPDNFTNLVNMRSRWCRCVHQRLGYRRAEACSRTSSRDTMCSPMRLPRTTSPFARPGT